MIRLGMQIRRAIEHDHRQLSNLIFQESNTHRHLDWRPALEWLGDPNFWVIEEHGEIIATLICSEDPPNVAWIRLFSHRPHHPGPEAWSVLWSIAQTEIFSANPNIQIASIVMKQWFQTMLFSCGFELRQNIVLLELNAENYHPPSTQSRVHIRPMNHDDLPMVEEVDLSAFGPFWHNSYDSLKRAYSQAVYSSVAEDETGVIGYQISTGNPFGAHLARLGVRPEAQGRGVGSTLVHELIRRLGLLPLGRLSVNTQEDNNASMRLYRRLGFMLTGETYPVLVYSKEKGL
ncbi:MAG TPA: GNAT family N-acetyltransferase [Anaerolineales bacterium]|nr:GNAT family N-acetyltransferase [Anaerolineales bacterium]HNA88989.1 GNAT family N-acetyltransferase [Anaerolineales bacterium]HNB36553.1 GNAT family N-acetyltransferase [Anaerolineales bacterium]